MTLQNELKHHETALPRFVLTEFQDYLRCGRLEYGFEVSPVGAAQWRRGDEVFFWAGEAQGWRGLRSNTWLVEAAVFFDEGREESDSDNDRLDGLGNADETVELVLQARRAFDSDWRYWLDGRVAAGEDGGIGIFGVDRRFTALLTRLLPLESQI